MRRLRAWTRERFIARIEHLAIDPASLAITT